MSLSLRTLQQAISGVRASGATRWDSAGNNVGIDFVTVSAVAASIGSKTYTVGLNRGWVAGQTVSVVPTDNTANISMLGTVTSYSGSTLVLDITSVGTDTTTTKTDWRIGHTSLRLEHSFSAPYLRMGALFEEFRVNSIRNSEGFGATTGTVGATGVLPTNWSLVTSGGLTCDVTSAVSDRGISGINVRFYGTTSGTSAQIRFDSLTQITHIPGSLWTQSLFSKVVAEALTNVTSVNLSLEECNNASGVQLKTLSPISIGATLGRFEKSIVTTHGTGTSTSRLAHGIQLNFSSGVVVDVTLFIGGIQLEQARTSVRAATAQAGTTSTITLDASSSSTDNAYQNHAIVIRSGTGSLQTRTISSYVGSTKVATVSAAWSTIPDSTSVFSVYRTETIEDAASSYIPTRSAAFTRSADLFSASNFSSFFTGSSASEGTIFVEAVSARFLDTTQSSSPRIFSIDNGTTQNDIRIVRVVSGLNANASVTTSNVGQVSSSSGVSWPANTSRKMAFGYRNNDCTFSYEGGAVITDISTPNGMPTDLNILVLGTATISTITNGNWNGYIKSLRFFPRRVSNADLVSLSSGAM